MKYKNLVEAAYRGNPADIQECLLNNIDINEQQEIGIKDAYNYSSLINLINCYWLFHAYITMTPLHAAVKARNIDNVRALLANGADSYINANAYYGSRNNNYYSWLYLDPNELAQEIGLVDLMLLFAVTRLKNNTKVDMVQLAKSLVRNPMSAQQYEELTAAMPVAKLNKFLLAVVSHDVLLPVTIALRKGADLKAVDSDGKTALHLALGQSKLNLNMIKQLLAHGADPNTVDNDGNTALHLALMKNSTDVNLIKTICAYGANKQAKNKAQQTPLDLCKNLVMRQALLAMPSSLPPVAQVVEDEAASVSNASCSCVGFLWPRARSAANQPIANAQPAEEVKLALA